VIVGWSLSVPTAGESGVALRFPPQSMTPKVNLKPRTPVHVNPLIICFSSVPIHLREAHAKRVKMAREIHAVGCDSLHFPHKSGMALPVLKHL
jgi:hypothetical protein